MSLNYQKRYNQDIRAWLLNVFRFASKIHRASLRRRKCPACGSIRSLFFANNGALNYDRCKSCALVFMNPALPPERLNAGFKGDDNIVMAYFRMMKKYATTPSRRPDPLKDDKLRDIYRLKRSGRLLDVGCSLGTFLHKAAHFYEVEGLEVNPYTAAISEKHFRVYKEFLSDLRLPQVYDIVTLHQVLYGVPDPAGLLRDIRKILKKDGLLYINTPNSDSLAMALYKGRCNHLYGYTTQNVFNKKSLTHMAAATGYKILSFRTEWLDLYTPDLVQYLSNPLAFIHKRNSHIPHYEEQLKIEDDLHSRFYPNLGNNGNYLVAVLAPH